MDKTIEQKVAEAILQKDVASIEIDGETYPIAPPSIATLILISGIISTLPIVPNVKDDDTNAIVSSVLHHAKGFEALGDIAAVLILGAKRAPETVTEYKAETREYLFGLIKRQIKVPYQCSLRERLARLILDNVRPSVLWNIIVKRLNMHEIGDFFLITTSLSEANLLKPTKEVD